ncbi:MAG: AAA family ATPase, partial [Candidatus Dormibacteria bacterium]
MFKPNYDAVSKEQFLKDLRATHGSDIITTKELNVYVKSVGKPFPHFICTDKTRNAGWGKYYIGAGSNPAPTDPSRASAGPKTKAAAKTIAALQLAPVVQVSDTVVVDVLDEDQTMVPIKDPTYEPFGFHSDLVNIIHSKVFYPIYITGLSGNGKTLMVLQVAALLKRDLVRVNITKDTDELDLFGAYELINGNTVRREGPVLTAMRRGAILLLDETDYGSERLLCLQPVLEGKPFLDKKTNTIVHPAPGFNVIACANTKGKGSNDGRFIGANVLNEAFLERFAITVEQDYP